VGCGVAARGVGRPPAREAARNRVVDDDKVAAGGRDQTRGLPEAVTSS